jgi:hypothetical protein
MAAFGLLWALAILYHQIAYRATLASAADAALCLAAVWTLFRPASAAVLAVLATLHVGVVVRHLPDVFNHWFFAGFVSLALLAAISEAWWRSPRATPPAPARIHAAFLPAGRACLVVLYLVSGFHKLNADFLTPGVSCASALSAVMARRLALPALGPALDGAAILGTLAAELGLPVLLLVRRTRLAAVIAGALFHVALGFAGYPRFSAICFALLVLFVPPPASPAAGRTSGWLARLHARLAPAPPEAARVSFLALAVPGLVLVAGATPYLGLGTERALSMYSNLRTEGGRSNHLIVPAGLQPFPFQKDVVELRASSVPRLRRLAAAGLVIPYAELRAILSREVRAGARGLVVVFSRGGVVREAVPAEADPDLALPVSPAAMKLLRFRAVEPSGPRRCGT